MVQCDADLRQWRSRQAGSLDTDHVQERKKDGRSPIRVQYNAALGGGSTVKKSCSDRTASGASNVIGNDVISARRLSSR
ncbi:hypothetical protein QE152_g7892 [Popillia japonica]|uniref:Uncharacterized protein n=1 Tax=Popillia japonica TaxID=7064 RepID=A0AAW1MCW7_POPJA